MRFFRRSAVIALALPCCVPLWALESGVDRVNMDPSVRIQDDLYLAVNGNWLKTTEIPADKSNYGAFTRLDDEARDRIQKLIDTIAGQKNPPGSDAQKIADLYRTFMDEARLEKKGIEPLRKELNAVDQLRSHAELGAYFGRLTTLGVEMPLAFAVDTDAKDSTNYLSVLWQSGTTLPDRDYYLLKEPRYEEARAALVSYVEQLLSLAGTPAPEVKEAAGQILQIETRLAQAQWPREQLRDPQKTYNKTAVTDLQQIGAGFGWNDYLGALGLSGVKSVNVGQPTFVKAAAELISGTPVEVWRRYLTFKLLDAYAIALPKAYQKAHFEFHGKVLAGIPQDKPRARKAVELISGTGDTGVLGEALGKIYVERYFPPEAKRRMDLLVGNLLKAYDRSINDLTWMSPETKAKAREKLSKFSVKIGYPVRWRDYSDMTIVPDDLVQNLMAASVYQHNYDVRKLGRPVDRDEWFMTPQTVNAYYNPNANEIVFPAAILQPPFFNVNADDAVNYGGIGAVIGHEISHGFDDQGSQYDGDGNLSNWWTPEDRAAFEALTKRLVAQYSSYEALPGKHVNGEFTLGENIADLSGIAIAYKAYRLSLQGKEPPVIDGMSGDQRFYLGWAQVWRRKYREAELANRLLTDPHSPSEFRANGPAINSDAFEQAFDVKPGDRMYKAPDERIRIW